MSYVMESPGEKKGIMRARLRSCLLYTPPLLMMINCIFLNGSHLIQYAALLGCLAFGMMANLRKLAVSKSFFVAVLGIALALVSAMVNGSGFGSFVAYANLMMFSVLYSEIDFTPKQRKNMYTIVLLSLLAVLLIFSKYNHISTYYHSVLPALTAEKLNPNTVGLLAFFVGYFALSLCRHLKTRWFRELMYIVITAAVFALIWQSHARTSLLAFGMFVTSYFVFQLFRKRKNFYLKAAPLFLLGLLLSLLFVYAYIFLYQHMGSVTVLGKSLFTGRQKVWGEALQLIYTNPWFGNNNSYQFGGYTTNAHNALLSVLFMFGIAPTALLLAVLYQAYKAMCRRCDPMTVHMIFCCIFIMIFETILTDSNIYYYFTLLFMRKEADP